MPWCVNHHAGTHTKWKMLAAAAPERMKFEMDRARSTTRFRRWLASPPPRRYSIRRYSSVVYFVGA